MRTKSVGESRHAFLICTPETADTTRQRYAATKGAAAEPLVLAVRDDGKLDLLREGA